MAVRHARMAIFEDFYKNETESKERNERVSNRLKVEMNVSIDILNSQINDSLQYKCRQKEDNRR